MTVGAAWHSSCISPHVIVTRALVLFSSVSLLAACRVAEADTLPCEGSECGAAGTPGDSDGTKNSGEPGQNCVDDTNCAGACKSGICEAPGPQDGKKDNDETDVDCGGTTAPKCADGKACQADSDCANTYCKADTKTCETPRPDDGVKNADETDTDCGGSKAPKCAVGKACLAHSDCDDGCGEASHVCVKGKSCVKHNGGDTCGATESATGSCCETAPLSKSSVTIDKYGVTAGRMRAMIERLNGDVRTFVSGLAADKWNQAWNDFVPSNVAEANMMLGSYWPGASNDSDGNNSKRSCAPGGYNGRTYWMPRINGDDDSTDEDDDFSDFTQDQLDPKALNCVGWHLATAFCRWDGGRLATSSEIANAYTNGSTTSYPWGSAAPSAPDDRMNHLFNYGYPSVPGQRLNGEDALDIAWYISPPGRFPLGNNQQGVSDIAGNLMPWVADSEYGFDWTFSWENHDGYPVHKGAGQNFTVQSWRQAWPGEPNGYYALGIRCAHD